MKFKALIPILLSLILIYSCNTEKECDGVDCEIEPLPLLIELIDEQTNENMFAAGILNDSSDFYIVNGDLESQKYTVRQDNYLIEMPDITKQLGPIVYQIIIRNSYIITFKLDMQSNVIDCCTNYILNDFKVSTHTYEFSEADFKASITVNLDQ